MENNEDKGNAPSEPKVTAPPAPPKAPSSSGKWIAVIIALLVVVGVLGGLLAMNYHPSAGTTGPSATLSSQVGAIGQGASYSTNITASSSFKNMTVYFGDGNSKLVNYSGSDTVKVTHTYAQPGEFYIFADINYGSSTGYFFEPVKVTPNYPSINYAYAALAVDPSTSSAQQVNNISNIFSTGGHMRLDFLPAVGGGSYEIVTQTLTLYNQTGMVSQETIPYMYNINSQGYQLPISGVTYADLQNGMYTLEVQTTTAPVNDTQTVSTTVTNVAAMNFTNGQNYVAPADTMLSANLSMVSMSFTNTNVSYGKDTTVKYGSSGTLFVGTTTNVTVNGGSLTYYNATKTKTISSGMATINATYNITLSSGLNLTYNVATLVNSSGTVAGMFYGSNSSFTAVDATTLTFGSAATNVTVTQMLAGTATIPLNNGQYDQSKTVTSTYYEDFPVAPQVTQQTSTETVFTNAEPNAPGGYTTLDPSIAYYTADSEILNNALLQLDTYNGSSTSSFVPMAALYLPTAANGGITDNGQNYTFHINTGITFQDGTHLSAWDVMYTFTRTLLFDAASPGTGGWVIAQYLLPGDFFASNTFYNITHNITVNNSTNTITFHFQQAMPSALVFQIFASSGTWIEPAAWYEAHGAGITWTPKGFQQYQNQGNLADYNAYVQNHVLADGPYMISYIIPGSQVTMVKNPDFVQPNNTYFRKPTIDRVNILYLSSNEQAFLLLKSGQATNAALPTSYWNQTQAMVQSGFLQETGFPTLSVYFYTFTLNTNLSILKTVTSQANLPSNFFMNPNVRKAFAYAYNYSLYYAQQVGNQIYNATFLSPYVGMLPPGMLYAQTAQDLINNGTNVINANGHENFQITMAQKYWNAFLNSPSSSHDGWQAMGMTKSGSTLQFNGKALSVPIMIPNSDPTDKAAVTTWAADLAQATGISAFPVELPLTDIFAAYAIPGQNPMAVSWGGWAPDYPYPTDYLLPMGMPLNSSTYMGPAGYTPWVVNGTVSSPGANVYNMSEASMMQVELRAFNNATSNATNPTAAKHWFQVANGMMVNSTIQVYIGQQYLHWVMSSKITHSDLVNYQQNVMIGGGQDLQYNLLSFTTS